MSRFGRNTRLPRYLREEQVRIEEVARGHGLDFFPTVFEMLAYDQMSEVAALGGFPSRYPHWRFGMEYEQLSKSATYGLSKIYEMVINTVPAVAYLLEGNSLVEQKLVMSHVLGHVDFFKNNFAFRITDQGQDRVTGLPIRKWIDTMANHGALVRRWIDRQGVDEVEQFLDCCSSLENLIDPHGNRVRAEVAQGFDDGTEEPEEPSLLRVNREYMESFINPEDFVEEQRRKARERKEQKKDFPERPERDVLGFLVAHAPLDRWERDLLTVVRREAYYFLPQMQTKIMNEGWASYWHSRLMTESVCDGSEIIDYAEKNAGVMAVSGGQLNPYKLGVELFRHIERRWDRGQFGREWDECDDLHTKQYWDRRTHLGQQKIFEVRSIYNDVTFVDEFLTPDFVMDQKMFSFGYNNRNGRWEIESRTFRDVKNKLLQMLTNSGQPVIQIKDANLSNRGELLLEHEHHGVDLDVKWALPVLESLNRIWKRPVEVQTSLEGKLMALRYDGVEHSRRSA